MAYSPSGIVEIVKDPYCAFCFITNMDGVDQDIYDDACEKRYIHYKYYNAETIKVICGTCHEFLQHRCIYCQETICSATICNCHNKGLFDYEVCNYCCGDCYEGTDG